MLRPVAPTRILLVFLFTLFAGNASAQVNPDAVPVLEEAESYFQQALESFEEGDYATAHRRFRAVYSIFPLNAKTTAAELMAGKALYRAGEYEESIEHLTSFIDEYPTSGYLGEASRTVDLSRAALVDEAEAQQVAVVGVALPLREEDAAITQVLFNGIRLAVDEHNLSPDLTPIRLIFRDSGGTEAGARNAVQSLVDANAEVIIGPLYSNEAVAAASLAEDAGVVLVPPLATDEAVADGKQFVFQANPTMATRGRQMARFAVETLRLTDLGVIAESNVQGLSERMAEGFQDEALRLGANVQFFTLLPGERAWSRLPEEVGAVQLASVSAVYMPIAGLAARQLERAALAGLDSMSVDSLEIDVRVLGNSEWHGMTAADQASRYGVTYTHDFYPNESRPETQAFLRSYTALAGESPSGGSRRLAYTGYDVAQYLITRLEAGSGQPLWRRLREAPFYQGLGTRIHFEEGNVNEALYFLQYQNGGSILLR